MKNVLKAVILCLLVPALQHNAFAGDVSILAADFSNTGGDNWSLNVSLKHADSGWDHYADSWRVVDGKGSVLGERVLLHPHVDEQPFTRGLSGITLPPGDKIIYIEAHDKVHGWAPAKLKVDLSAAKNGHLQLKAQ